MVDGFGSVVVDPLSKYDILTGLRCPKALWWLIHEPDAPELTADSVLLDRFDQGCHVGALARKHVPGGILVGQQFEALVERVARTREAMRNGEAVLYEAAFNADGAFVQVDILERLPEGWRLIEVKSSTSVASRHIADAAVQLCVLRRAGLDVRRVEVMHLNKACYFPELDDLFVRADVTADAGAAADSLAPSMAGVLAAVSGHLPATPTGDHCRKPDPCPFVPRCHAATPVDHIDTLYRLGSKRRQSLVDLGIERISQIPDDFALTAVQERQRRSLRSNEIVVELTLAQALEGFRDPIAFLDFETISRAVPVWEKCAPWQQVPAQFSCHVRHADGRVDHREWLADGPGDPRRELAERLVAACAEATAVLAYYVQFEKSRIEELAWLFPDLKSDLYGIADRLADLLPIVREHVYHPAFGGSFSLKAVAPPLIGIDYGELEVASGGEATLAIARLLLTTDVLSSEERAELRAQLLAYCKQDTWCLVQLLSRLRELAASA
jgi:predicted RecB family nuclease